MKNEETKNQLEPKLWGVKYKEYLCVMARKKLPSDMVEDIVQDTFLAALHAAPRFKGRSSERVWLTAILNNKIMDHYRSVYSQQGRVSHMAVKVSDHTIPGIWDYAKDRTESNDAITFLYADELQMVLQSGLKLLGSREQQVLDMKIKGFSTEAICDILDINKINAWVALSRARKKIKAYLEENWHNVA